MTLSPFLGAMVLGSQPFQYLGWDPAADQWSSLDQGEDVTHYGPEKRAKYLSRVFQDPKMGTALV